MHGDIVQADYEDGASKLIFRVIGHRDVAPLPRVSEEHISGRDGQKPKDPKPYEFRDPATGIYPPDYCGVWPKQSPEPTTIPQRKPWTRM
jgi:hypothetical protein